MPEPDYEALSRRLLERAPTFDALEVAFNRVMRPKLLQHYIQPKGTIQAIEELLTLLESWSELDAAEKIAAAAKPTFDHQILDLVHFDLAPIENDFVAAWMDCGWPKFVGASIIAPEDALKNVRRRLGRVINATDPRHSWTLDPAIGPVDQVLDVFELVSSLGQATVVSIDVASAVDDRVLATVWQKMVASTVGRSKPMLALFSASTHRTFPAQLIELPSPRFCAPEVAQWVMAVGEALEWEPECRQSAATNIWTKLAAGAAEVEPVKLYTALDILTQDLVNDPEAFRASVCA